MSGSKRARTPGRSINRPSGEQGESGRAPHGPFGCNTSKPGSSSLPKALVGIHAAHFFVFCAKGKEHVNPWILSEGSSYGTHTHTHTSIWWGFVNLRYSQFLMSRVCKLNGVYGTIASKRGPSICSEVRPIALCHWVHTPPQAGPAPVIDELLQAINLAKRKL